jgi:hypothetical protein
VPVVCHTGAQVLAAFGAVDVPQNAWPGLLSALFHNINSNDISDVCKVASLEVRSFITLWRISELPHDNSFACY